MRNLWLSKFIYSPESLEEAEKIRLKLPTLFKHRPTVKGITIDGEHSPDLDDAIWVRQTHFGYQIDVHIADVASLIEVNSFLFKQAARKKTSLYYGNHLIDHMLPPVLSENLFSLLESQKRLTVTIRTELNVDLDIINKSIFKSRLTSQKRFTHGEASQLIRNPHTDLGKMLELAYKLSVGLVNKRFSKRKASLMDIAAGIYLDKYGNVRKLNYSSASADLLIYSLMVLSNEMVSQYFIENNLPGLFRNHAPKNKNEIKEIIQRVIKNNEKVEIPPTKIQRFLKSIVNFLKRMFFIKVVGDQPKKQLDESSLDPKLLSRLNKSFLRAKYEVENKGHESLLIDSYFHFTSPIRRLADLINHLVLHARLNSLPTPFTRRKLRKLAKSINNSR